MTKIQMISEGETRMVEAEKVDLYKICGWTLTSDLLKFESKQEEEEAWMNRFGD